MKGRSIKLKELQINTGQIEGLPKNPRFIKDERFNKLVKSIQDDPEMLELRELIVFPFNDKFVVIGGNMRLRAIRQLKHQSAPCKVLPEDTPIKKLQAYLIKDNVSFGEYEYCELANDWDEELLGEWGVDLPIWEPGQIQRESIDEELNDSSLTFVTQIMQIRNNIGGEIEKKKGIIKSDAFIESESLIIKLLKENEYYID